MREISNHILVGKFVEGKEDHIVRILVRRFVIKENVNLVNMRELWFRVNVGKAQGQSNVVNKDKFFNAEKNVKKYSTVSSINAKETVIMENVFLAKKNIWSVATAKKMKMLSIVFRLLILVKKYVVKN